jgi:hypothetical protein
MLNELDFAVNRAHIQDLERSAAKNHAARRLINRLKRERKNR